MGIETAIYTTLSAEGDVDGETFELSQSSLGLPGSPGVSIGIAMEHVDLGFGFGLSNPTTEIRFADEKVKTTSKSYAVNPYVGYLSGSGKHDVRALLGIGIGYGSETSETTDGEDPYGEDSEDKATTSSFSFGFVLGLRIFGGEWVSFDPTLRLMKSSATLEREGVEDVSLSGVSAVLSIGLSAWPGSTSKPEAKPKVEREESPSTESRYIPPPSSDTASTEPRRQRATISFGGAKMALLVGSSENAVEIVLKEGDSSEDLAGCRTVTLHAPNQEDVILRGQLKEARSSAGTVPFLRAKVTADQLGILVQAPITELTPTSDHWIDICGKKWILREPERAKIVKFLDSLGS